MMLTSHFVKKLIMWKQSAFCFFSFGSCCWLVLKSAKWLIFFGGGSRKDFEKWWKGVFGSFMISQPNYNISIGWNWEFEMGWRVPSIIFSMQISSRTQRAQGIWEPKGPGSLRVSGIHWSSGRHGGLHLGAEAWKSRKIKRPGSPWKSSGSRSSIVYFLVLTFTHFCVVLLFCSSQAQGT